MATRYCNFDLATGNNDGTTENDAWRTWADFTGGVATGDYVYFKQTSSPWQISTTQTLSVTSARTGYGVLEGYVTTPGDGGHFYVQATANNSDLSITGEYWIIKNFVFDSNTYSSNINFNARGLMLYRCKVTGEGANATGSTYRCWFDIQDNDSAARVEFGSWSTFNNITFSTFFKRSNIGTLTSTRVFWNEGSQATAHFYDIFALDTTPATTANKRLLDLDNIANTESPVVVYGARFYNAPDDAIWVDDMPTGAKNMLLVLECYFEDVGGYCVANDGVDTPDSTFIAGNRYRSATSGMTNYSNQFGDFEGAAALTADAFVDPGANNDYEINNTAGGGAVLRAVSRLYDPTI
jgi:hypothetical protein